jgi:hypothetical protein
MFERRDKAIVSASSMLLEESCRKSFNSDLYNALRGVKTEGMWIFLLPTGREPCHDLHMQLFYLEDDIFAFVSMIL